MTPSWRRCLLAAVALGIVASAPIAGAQQVTIGGKPAAASQSKAATSKSQAEKRRPAAKAAAAKGAKAAKADPAAAQGEVEAGINALGQGRLDAAVASLSNAVSAGSLPSAQTARALYYRGVAHRRQSKPALAISDLTNALWIKAGLTEEQRADALQQRTGAYREAGLPDQADPPSSRKVLNAKAGSATAPFAGVAPPAPSGSSTTLSSAGGFLSSLFGAGAPAPAVATGPAAAPRTEVAAAAVAARVPPNTTASIPAPPVGTQAQAVAPVAPPAKGQLQATRSVPVYSSVDTSLPAGFQDMGAPVRHVEVSTTARAAQPQPATPPGTVARSWEDTTKVKQARPPAATGGIGNDRPRAEVKPATKIVSVPPSPPVSSAQPNGRPTVAPAGGNVVIQVAAVRSAQEAQGVTAKLEAQFASELAGRAPVIDQVSAGNFGMFYRVQVGPFASVRETAGLCAKLKSGGLDCRVVGQ